MDQEQVGDMSHVEAVESVNASLQVQEEEQEEEQEQEQEEEQQQEEEVEQEDEEAHRITQLKSSNTRQTLVKHSSNTRQTDAASKLEVSDFCQH